MTILEIRHPRETRDDAQPIEAMAQGFAALSTSLGISWWKMLLTTTSHVGFEIAVFNQAVHFFVSGQSVLMPAIESQLTAQYPRILLRNVEDYIPSLFTHFHAYALGQMKLSAAPYYPLRTFRDFRDTDPLSAIIATLAKLGKDEAAFIQIVIKNASSKWQALGLSAIEKGLVVGDYGHRQRLPSERAIQQKIAQPGFAVSIRIAAFSHKKTQSKTRVSQIASSFGSVANGEGNMLVLKKPIFFLQDRFVQKIKKRAPSFFPLHQVLNSDELASIWHPPGYSLSKIKNLAWGQTFLGEAPLRICLLQKI